MSKILALAYWLVVPITNCLFTSPTYCPKDTQKRQPNLHFVSVDMPRQASTRSSTNSRVSRKASAPNLPSSRASAPTIVIPDEGPTSTLRTRICSIFGDAQRSTAGHRKLVVGLRKIQEACCYESDQGRQEFGEDDFNVEIARCVIRLMGVKKSEGVGDRILRYLGLFLRHASDKGKGQSCHRYR